MKSAFRMLVVGLGVLLMVMGVAFAGINPANVGLPTVLPGSMPADGYATGLSAIDNNNGSAMCVDCHGRNPSRHTNPTASTNLGSHWVTKSFNDTGSSGGYPGDGAKAATNGKYLHRGPWGYTDNTLVSALGVSKYGRLSGTVVQPDYTPAAGAAVDNTYQMICESCHNIVRNTGNNKLLAVAGANWDNIAGGYLCVGCHSDMSNAVNNEPPYFGAAVQDHHVNGMTAATVTPAVLYQGTAAVKTDRAMQTIDNAWYNISGYSRMWAVNQGQMTGVATPGRTYGFVVAADPGIKATPIATATAPIAGVTVASGVLHCNNCHRPHNAVSETGSLIVQNGKTGANAYTFGLLTSPTGTTAADADGVMVRQRDRGNPKTFTNKLIQDDNGLCAGCHANR